MSGRFSIVAALVGAGAAVFLTGCGDDREDAKTWKRPAYTPALPEPRRASRQSPETLRWLSAWEAVRGQREELRGELTRRQKLHADNHFDSFLELNLETLTGEQLTYLYHFLQKGYFRLEREVLLKLLEARAGRDEPVTEAGGSMASRIQSAMLREEMLVMDLETAIEAYGTPAEVEFQVPSSFTSDETARLITTVKEMMDKERAAIAGLDAKIVALSPPPPAPAPEPEAP